MARENFKLPSTRGDTELNCYRWIPEGGVRATVQLSHGMIEHILRYSDFAEFLNSNGIAVYGHDHLGHGNTPPDDLGFIAETYWDVVIVDDLFEVPRSWSPNIPTSHTSSSDTAWDRSWQGGISRGTVTIWTVRS